MKKDPVQTQVNSLTEVHRTLGLPNPQHPLISLLNGIDNDIRICLPQGAHVLHFYKISYKSTVSEKLKYGQGYYDFDEGGLMFASPNQVIGSPNEPGRQDSSMYTILIHPDFLWNYPLAKKIKQYGFFSYSANEALHLSEEERETVISIFRIIEKELNSRIDDFSQDVIISQIEVLLNYANRFYKRQFLTRKVASNDLLVKMEELLDESFESESVKNGIPTVHFLSEKLNISASYLSDMLRSLTGQNAQQHIHNKLIEKAKEKLSVTQLSVSEIAYELGFEHPQSFSKLFKAKTQLSPLEFRKSFN
ncbi:helix-turn-helix domain-containing protein [Flavobacterium silvaticum]|uniref:AraC family transcriptional regulator n=1 Tax=Flavobacterium silvaticum TaxID=1852020 RepID=A0A972FM37_9FLAO|nr:helix-turn-helix domain-containing protein [Flavobacterium silvaticum]NMH28248.1 AraC family transcriptional regulator [Flavobacterium silvaticum]